jgi:diguanylate cyclase (GGDEF)-like protein
MDREKRAILCVDDDNTVLNALKSLLSKNLKDTIIEVSDSVEDALEIIEKLKKDGVTLQVVVSEYTLPEIKGDKFLINLHKKMPTVIKIMLTGESSIYGIKRVINDANLYRFMEKPWNNDDFILTVNRAIKHFQQEKKLEVQNIQLTKMNNNLETLVEERTRELIEKNYELKMISITDRLTKVYNRLKLDEVFEDELSRATRYGNPFSIILLDIDKFKSINDEFGHQVGDVVLINIASIISTSIRKTDIIGRWGGEEFLVISRETKVDGAKILAEKLRTAIEDFDFPVVRKKTSSFGVTGWRENDTIETMVQRADDALYRAKRGGRNRVEVD